MGQLGTDGDNIKTELREIGWVAVEWINLAEVGAQ